MPRFMVHGATVVIGIIFVSVFYGTEPEFLSLYLGISFILVAMLAIGSRFNLTLAKVIYGVLLVPLISLACLHGDNYYRYGPLLKETIEAIFQTSNAEAASYMTEFSSPWLLPVSGLILIATLATLLRINSAPRPHYVVPVSFVLIGGLLVYTGRTEPLMIYDVGLDYAHKLETFSESRHATLERMGPINSSFKGNIVVVIGESTNRHHLQVYGYPRKTTPFLESIRDELVIYKDVIATHSHTDPSLSEALTFNKRHSKASFNEVADILTVANASGLETWWLSNQNAIGIWDNVVAAIANRAQQVKYHDPASGIAMERQVHDEELADSLRVALDTPSDSGKLIFLHTMATHVPYCGVIPQNFKPSALDYADPPMDARFYGRLFRHLRAELSQRAFQSWLVNINCYDRAVSYVDSILEKITGLLDKEPEPSVLLYLADHGEAPTLGTGHDSRQHSHFHVEIPFILWANEVFNKSRPRLSADPKVAASLADLSYTIADLAEISGPEDLSRRSIFSSSYEQVPRHTLDGKTGYDVYDDGADHVERTRANLLTLDHRDQARIWAHRVNSGGKMMVTKEIFRGLEMDLVFDKTAEHFSVYHPPSPNVGLTLRLLLRQDHKDLHYWLDWKNANREDIALALSRLEQLNSESDLKSRALIEISTLDGSAAKLGISGWKTSYYLPTDRISECLANCSKKQAAQLANELWDNFDANEFRAISLDSRLLPFIDTFMIDRVEEHNIPVYTWATNVDISAQDAIQDLKPLLDREWIEVILVTMPSYFNL